MEGRHDGGFFCLANSGQFVANSPANYSSAASISRLIHSADVQPAFAASRASFDF